MLETISSAKAAFELRYEKLTTAPVDNSLHAMVPPR